MLKKTKWIIASAFVAAIMNVGCAGSNYSSQGLMDETSDCELWTDIGCDCSLKRIQRQAKEGGDINAFGRPKEFWGYSKITGEKTHEEILVLLSHYRKSVEISPIVAAALRHDEEAVRWLVNQGAEPVFNARMTYQDSVSDMTGQDIAVLMNDLEALKLLVEASDGVLALRSQYVAAMPCMDPEIARFILDKRAATRGALEQDSLFSLAERDEDVELLKAAVVFGNKPLLEEFWKRGFSVDERTSGETLLMTAIDRNELEMAKYLIEKGADVYAKNDEDTTVWEMIMNHPGRSSLLKSLLPLGKVKLSAEETFEYQVKPESREYHQMMLQYGANTDGCTCDGKTLMKLAIEHEDPDLFKALIDGGADVNARTMDGKSLLIYLVERDEYHFVVDLINAGARIDECLVWQPEPVSETESSERMLGMEIPLYDDEGVCMLTCEAPPLESVEDTVLESVKKATVSTGQTLESGECVGKTALMVAIEKQNQDLVMALLDAGANVELTNSQGENAMNLAHQIGNEAIIELLEEVTDERENGELN